MSVAVVLVVGCTYSRWNYYPIDGPLEHDIWSVRCFFGGEEKGDSGTTLYYQAVLREEDTVQNRRLHFLVDSVRVSYSGLDEEVRLAIRERDSGGGEHVGATNVDHWVLFTPFQVLQPRPDTVIIDQVITILDRDSGEELTRLHYQVKAKVHRHRRWKIGDYIEGT